MTRASGILLHITSLPGDYGIGDFGKSAYDFIDFLSDTGQQIWQILPLGPTGYGNSPYSCTSTFAGNSLMIAIDKLLDDNLITQHDIPQKIVFPDKHVDYNNVAIFKNQIILKAFKRFREQYNKDIKDAYNKFLKQNSAWLETYALYAALREHNNFIPWNKWSEDIKKRNPAAIQIWTQKLINQINYHKFVQFLFFRQWSQLREYCRKKGISIIGDMPFYMSLDSDAVWFHPDIFILDKEFNPVAVAGVPPDYFSSTGQLWGNPIYNWKTIKRSGYKWWIDRFRFLFTLVDIVRIDHFRAFENYWEIPSNATTAASGQWRKGPGVELFNVIKKRLGTLAIIAEDLGIITPEVISLRDRLGFPGMRVLQFAFGDDSKTNPHKPYNFINNCIAYTGTHDNDTTIGWFNNVNNNTTLNADETAEERQRALKYLGTDGSEIHKDFIRLCLSSVADIAIIPMQDILGLGSESRMNTPSKQAGNWEWRFTFNELTQEKREMISELTAVYGRKPNSQINY